MYLSVSIYISMPVYLFYLSVSLYISSFLYLSTSLDLWISFYFSITLNLYLKILLSVCSHYPLSHRHFLCSTPSFQDFCLTLSWRGPLSYRTSPLICRADQWTGFYMITVSVMKELNSVFVILKTSRNGGLKRLIQLISKCTNIRVANTWSYITIFRRTII